MLGGSAALGTLPPVGKLTQYLMKNTINQAGATENYDSNYVAFFLFGGPNRWMFDQILKAKASDTLVYNPMVATAFTAERGAYRGTEYRTYDYKGVQVPAMWNSTVPVSGGGRVALSTLLDHMIVFRGYGSGVDGHPSNTVRQLNPVPGIGSITGHAADHGDALFRAVSYPSIQHLSGYHSLGGSGATTLHQRAAPGNLLKSLLQPFTPRPELQSLEAL